MTKRIDVRSYRQEPETEPIDRERYSRNPRRTQQGGFRGSPVSRRVFWVVLDILLIGIGLVIFAYFHHVAPRSAQMEAVLLPTPSAAAAVADTGTAADNPVDTGTMDTDTQTPAVPDVESGMWGAKFADKFTSGEVIQTDSTYQSKDINITVEKVQTSDVTYYVADIYVRNLENFKTAYAAGEYVERSTMEGGNAWMLDIANANDAIAAISGDYYNMRQDGIVIRNGVLARQNIFEDILIMYNDGSMQTFSPEDFDMNTIIENGAWQGWSFGPFLLRDGQAMEAGTFNSKVNPANPRSAIGYYEPGHYCFVLVDGRQPGYSNGMTLADLSQVFADSRVHCRV